uniref:DDE_Tnp_1_7 domain-containing protein n=1 Tax=Glossina pallidipes TaxID=7398 RepID=A0A1A9Z267_GLOPL
MGNSAKTQENVPLIYFRQTIWIYQSDSESEDDDVNISNGIDETTTLFNEDTAEIQDFRFYGPSMGIADDLKIVKRTRNCRLKGFTETNFQEMEIFFGLCLLQAQIKTPKIRSIWSNNLLYYHPIFGASMTGRSACLHILELKILNVLYELKMREESSIMIVYKNLSLINLMANGPDGSVNAYK